MQGFAIHSISYCALKVMFGLRSLVWFNNDNNNVDELPMDG